MAAAALRSVDPGRDLHSLHAYYLAPATADAELHYEVADVRDGRSVSVRRVEARQAGRLISTMQCLLTDESRDGPRHQSPAPRAPDPESLPTISERRRLAGTATDGFAFPPPADWREGRVPADVRLVDPNPTDPPGRRMFWLRAETPTIDTAPWHRIILAYLSDFSLLSAVLAARGELGLRSSYRVSSLDHSMWFHQSCRVDDWLLLVQDSPASSGAYGMARSLIFARTGVLVASVAQEGILLKDTDEAPDRSASSS
jgi:acyl-CoA thioesterase-2